MQWCQRPLALRAAQERIVKTPRGRRADDKRSKMNLADAVARAEKEGLSLPKVDKPFVLPPADSSKDWQNHPDGGERLGMGAARTAEGLGSLVDRRHIVKAASLAPVGLMALSLLVLHAAVKLDVVSYQIETGNGFRSYALLSGASLLRALACVSLLRDGYDACEALHRMIWHMFFEMDGAKPGISKGRAVLIVFSVTLRFAEEIFAGNDDAMSVVEIIRNVLSVTALCGYAARNCSYHSGEVAIRVGISMSRVDAIGSMAWYVTCKISRSRRPCKCSRISGKR